MKGSNNRKTINISSAGELHGLPEFSLYCGSKFTVSGITEAIVSELEGGKVHSICSGAADWICNVNLCRQARPQTCTSCVTGSGTHFTLFGSCIREGN
ncbi:hypothetical protein ACSAZL_10840 [Methanosarcina sp. T3]|uniref:hypothetical protein n=1 Tax=Methanosarcina sp. T3 TaxID=3439062 RepID=UPI003F859664